MTIIPGAFYERNGEKSINSPIIGQREK